MSARSDQLSVVVAGGGTAGHIEPALAVAESLVERHGARVTALGSRRGLERDLVPERGFDLRFIDPVPVPRRLNLDLLKLPWRIAVAVHQARKILTEVKADALIGFGGYVSAPAYLAARTLGIPFLVHEANAKAGMANKLGTRLGGIGYNAVPGSGIPGRVVGIPVRSGLREGDSAEAIARARKLWDLDPERKTLLVTGGSQGAVSINKAVAGAVDKLTDTVGIQILHAYGKRNTAPTEHAHYLPHPYIGDMAAAYAVADLIVCRSGAMTVAEVTASGLPAVYVPLPHGNGEQALNATEVVEIGAARIIDDADLTSERLIEEVTQILGDDKQLVAMKAAAHGHAAGDTAGLLADALAAVAADNSKE
ncbi:undecaprenyldiphospho-muramoylpentapeptide beta-N-acetylglucosaminyltransferase [Corynebacterium alimapuense]|uniref:UDP-N-acetylglucosamine--N-acetylmuramyl-(pentapeptide) pyrophosphoryl-undecaprenol N-acetylglucosamine transferase n=1 Tax=Corynebacterium alimapuense TaxID=1576874 RepID=A0A3M8K8C6_9CORY|nr:undecaprenyldiphospho-muramoylpentapeptide beta-N-acetylglucosaminyltransferase [Corynebacterium alimapuense]RNE49487.1 undecaprenyldiphospho-muramoylpentapeptide beta-N-acetylglucosaminyltransferase [Corynebacterium alimapuense]